MTITASAETVDCLIDESGGIYSKKCADRMVMEALFGFVLYEKDGNEGVNRGMAITKTGAYKWLNGDPIEDIEIYQTPTSIQNP